MGGLEWGGGDGSARGQISPAGKGEKGTLTHPWAGLSLQAGPGGRAGGRDTEGRLGETEAGGGVSRGLPGRSCSASGGSHPSENSGVYGGTWALLGYSALQHRGWMF